MSISVGQANGNQLSADLPFFQLASLFSDFLALRTFKYASLETLKAAWLAEKILRPAEVKFDAAQALQRIFPARWATLGRVG